MVSVLSWTIVPMSTLQLVKRELHTLERNSLAMSVLNSGRKKQVTSTSWWILIFLKNLDCSRTSPIGRNTLESQQWRPWARNLRTNCWLLTDTWEQHLLTPEVYVPLSRMTLHTVALIIANLRWVLVNSRRSRILSSKINSKNGFIQSNIK